MDIISRIAQNIGDINIIGQFVGWLHSWIGDYGLTVIVFTLFLKLITLPLDFWQRYSMKKNSACQKELQPQVEKIDKQYANDPNRAMQEKNALYKKYGFSVASGCLPLIVTMAIFWIMFSGLSAYSSYSSNMLYNKLVDSYNTTYVQYYTPDEIVKDREELQKLAEKIAELNKKVNATTDETEIANLRSQIEETTTLRNSLLETRHEKQNKANTEASKAVAATFDAEREGFLWVKNIYRPDTWTKVFPSYEEASAKGANGQGIDKTKVTVSDYNIIYKAVMQSNAGEGYFGGWNGLLILPILAIGLSFVSSLIAQRQNKIKGVKEDPQTAKTNKITMLMMPLIFALFVFNYTSAFSVYMVVSSILSILIGLIINPLTDKMAVKKVAEKFDSYKPTYSRK